MISYIYELIGKKKFEPTEITPEERIEVLEAAVIELAEIVIGGESNS